MKQRVLIAAGALHDPDVLILDEPLSGIDVTSALLFTHLLAETGGSRQDDLIYFARSGGSGKIVRPGRDHL